MRTPWPDTFPPIVIHALWADGSRPPRAHLKRHPAYHAAKYRGDLEAALQVVVDLHDADAVRRLRRLGGRDAIVLSPRPRLEDRLNMLPLAFEQLVADSMGWRVEERVMQTHVTGRTGRGNWARFTAQPVFEGGVERNGRYVILDDVLTLGGTIAGLRSHVVLGGGEVVAASCLAHKLGRDQPLAIEMSTLQGLGCRFGGELDRFWRREFGHGVHCCTEAEGRFLLDAASFDRIREGILGARNRGSAASFAYPDP